MDAWEQEWIDGLAYWQAQLDAETGVFSALCQMGALDELGPEAFLEWYRREAR